MGSIQQRAAGGNDAECDIAAVVYSSGDDPDALLRSFSLGASMIALTADLFRSTTGHEAADNT
jgi:hypothetical protein